MISRVYMGMVVVRRRVWCTPRGVVASMGGHGRRRVVNAIQFSVPTGIRYRGGRVRQQIEQWRGCQKQVFMMEVRIVDNNKTAMTNDSSD